VAKSIVICVEFLPDVPCQKLLKSANAARSYSKNKIGSFFMDHGVGNRVAKNSNYLEQLPHSLPNNY